MNKVAFYYIIFGLIFMGSFLYDLSNDEKNFKIGGTYIIAAICQEGIIVGADSRSCFYNKKGQIAAYYDGAQKIFQNNNIIITMAGQHIIDTISVKILLKKFQKAYKKKLEPNNFYYTFLRFASTQLSENQYKKLLNNQFLVCGYLKNRPAIYSYHGIEKDSFFKAGEYKTNDKDSDNYTDLVEYLKRADIGETLTLVKILIGNIAVGSNKDTISGVGGDASLVYITKDNVKWVQRQNKYEYNSSREFFNNYMNGNVKLWYRSKEDSILLRRGFEIYYR